MGIVYLNSNILNLSMGRSFIIVSDILEKELVAGLTEFADGYSDCSFAYGIQLYKNAKTDNYLILFSFAPEFMYFAFAVNYIRYIPIGKKFAEVSGYFLNTAREELQYFLDDDFVKVYVSRNDTEFDNVHFVNKHNQTYLYDFGGKFSKLSIIEKSYDVDKYILNDYEIILKTAPKPKEEVPWWKFW